MLLVPAVVIRNVIVGALGLSADWVAPATIEVVRRTDGSLVGRIPVESSYSEQVDALASVRQSLASESTVDFLAEWDLRDGG